MYPGRCTARVYDESTLVKVMLRQRDLAGIHFFYNGSGGPLPYLYRMKALYLLDKEYINKSAVPINFRFCNTFKVE
jgi:hypothetical protein